MVIEIMTVDYTYCDFKVIIFMTIGHYNYDHMVTIIVTYNGDSFFMNIMNLKKNNIFTTMIRRVTLFDLL